MAVKFFDLMVQKGIGMKLEQHFNERNRRDLGIVWFIISLIVMLGGFSGGLVFSLLGLIWLASARGEGLEWAREHPDLMKTSLLAITIIMILLALYFILQNII